LTVSRKKLEYVLGMNKHIEKVIRKLEIETAIFFVIAVMVFGGIGEIANGLKTKAADPVSQFTQTINNGVLTAAIRDSSRITVSSPGVTFGPLNFSFDCLTGANSSDGILGTDAQRLYVDNPGAASGGWNLTMAATSGGTAVWSDGGSNAFDFNDASGAGCTDGAADADSVAGQMTVDPVNGGTGAVHADYSGGSIANITLQSTDKFVETTHNTITLVSATSAVVPIWRGYFTGIDIKNTIPAEQAPATYTLNFTLTATAL